MTEQRIIYDGGALRRWRTEIPNIIDDSDLDPYEFRLLIHYYRVAANSADGCYEGAQMTADKCHISKGQVSQKRQSLADKGWISVEADGPKNRQKITIRIVDKWADNTTHFSNGLGSPHEPGVHHMNPQGSPHEPKKEQYKKEPIKNSISSDSRLGFLSLCRKWSEVFPDKPQPRSSNKTLLGKMSTRMQSKHFRENWEQALTVAGRSQFLHESGWFDVGWFLKNDDNYEKCLNGKYSDSGSTVRQPNVAADGGVSSR